MINLMLLVALLLTVGVGTGVLLWKRLHPQAGPETPALPDRPASETYAPMCRLFTADDFDLLTAAGEPDLAKRLRRQRRRVLRLYLGELRRDFEQVHGFCRLLAGRSLDPGFAPAATRQALAFYGLLLMVQARCALGWWFELPAATTELVDSFERLCQAARTCAAALAQEPAAQTA